MNCATTYIVNPKTNKCVKKTGKIGKNITEIKYCRLILNPKTGKCIKKTGKTAEKIKSPLKYPKKNENFENVDKLNYRTSAASMFSMLLYFSYKYLDDCIIVPKSNFETKKKKWQELALFYDKDAGFIIPKNYFEEFQKCKNKRFIILPLIFRCSDDSVHVNYIIYDSRNKSMERFEPNGNMSNPCYNIGIDEGIKKIFNIKMGKDFVHQYYKPLDFCPDLNLQKIAYRENEGGKLCAIWSNWYAELRLLNPDINRKELVNRAIKDLKSNKRKTKESLTSFIKKYADVNGMIHELLKDVKDENEVFKQLMNIM
jgi:hypothetical protein